jgi:ATP-dependent helicase/nuclease subunit B
MSITVVASTSNHRRIERAQDWLKGHQPTEEILIIGPTLTAANEVTRTVARTKGASFGYHRMSLGQLASKLARPALTTQNLVPLGALGV